MKTISNTTTNHLFGKVNHCGTYAGEYQEKAFELLQEAGFEKEMLEDNEWCDIMYFYSTGEVIALYGEDSLTSYSDCFYIYLDRSDCEDAFDKRDEKERN